MSDDVPIVLSPFHPTGYRGLSVGGTGSEPVLVVGAADRADRPCVMPDCDRRAAHAWLVAADSTSKAHPVDLCGAHQADQ